MIAIWKREYQSYFHSVIGYVFIGVFLIFASCLFLFNNIAPLSSELQNMFSSLTFILTFLVPILTMRLFSEERKTKTDQILITAPVSVWDIVLGKYLAAMSVFAIALIGALVFPILLFWFGRPEIGVFCTIYLGFFLLGGVFIALGLFISTLTENQVISAILTFGFLLLIQWWDAFQGMVANDWFNRIWKWFSLLQRYHGFTFGVFNIEHLVFFLSLIFVFLLWTVHRIEKRRWS